MSILRVKLYMYNDISQNEHILKLLMLSALPPNLFFTMLANSLGLDTIVLEKKTISLEVNSEEN